MKDIFERLMLNINTSVKHSKEEIDLYKELSFALELMKNDNFTVEDSELGKNLWFSITTPYPDGLPINISSMFFNVNTKFDVQIRETQVYAKESQRHFHINLKKI